MTIEDLAMENVELRRRLAEALAERDKALARVSALEDSVDLEVDRARRDAEREIRALGDDAEAETARLRAELDALSSMR
jgi:tellurite resistance protein